MIENEDVEILKNKINEVREVLYSQIEELATNDNDGPSWFEIEKDDVRQVVSDFTEKLLLNVKEAEVEK